MSSKTRRCSVSLALMAIAVIGAAPLRAQTTSASIQGTVSDTTGLLPVRAIVAKDTQSGFTYEATSGAEGFFALKGLRPGTYECMVTMPPYSPSAARAGAGRPERHRQFQNHVRPRPHRECDGGRTANRLVETKTAEISTSVTTEQVRYLPRTSGTSSISRPRPWRQGLAGRERKEVSAGRPRCDAGQCFHRRRELQNDVLTGGVAGQDWSHGPVPAERRAGVPGPHAELQGRAREGLECGDHRGDQERHHPLGG